MDESNMPATLLLSKQVVNSGTLSITTVKPRPKRLRYTEDGYGYSHASSTPPTFPDLDNFDANLFNSNLAEFLHGWIPQTLSIFAPTGPAIFTRAFWASQMRSDLYQLLWQTRYLGREATEDELDWLVEAALRVQWPCIETMLERRLYDESAETVVERYPRRCPGRTRLRRVFVLGEMMARLSIGDEEESWCQGGSDGEIEEGMSAREVRRCMPKERKRGTVKRGSVVCELKVEVEDLDQWSEPNGISDVVAAKVKARPAQAGSLLKKTLRNL
jgi:hypothetical protein